MNYFIHPKEIFKNFLYLFDYMFNKKNYEKPSR